MEDARAPLIGRERPLAVVVEAIRTDRSVAVVGEAGIGKTTLVRAAVAASERGLREGGGFATLAWMPNLPLERAVDSPVSGDPASVAAAVERIVGPDVLFVDDLQWADPDTLAALELLAGRVALVVGIRDGDPGHDRALEVMTRSGAVILRLAPLAAAAAAAVVRGIRPALSPALVADLVQQAGGNPLLLEELATQGRPSAVLERVLGARIEHLGPAARDAVELLAVAERPLARAALGSGVAEAIAAGLLVERGDGVEIRHVLVAAAIGRGLSPAARRRLHLRLAGLVAHRGEAARHLVAAGRRREAAATALEALTSTDAPAEPRERAALLVIAAEASPASASLELRVRAARALDEVSEWAAVIRVLDSGSPRGSAELMAEREAILAHAAFRLGDLARSRSLITAASARSIDPGSEAGVRRTIESATFMVNVDGAVIEALGILDAALANPLSRSRDQRDLEVLRASIALLAAPTPADVALVQAAAGEAFEEARYRTAIDRTRVVQYLLLLGVGADAAFDFLVAQIARFQAAGLGSAALEFQSDAVVAACLGGHFERAIGLADELMEQPAPARARQTAEIYRARALATLGRFDEAERVLAALLPLASPDFLGRGDTLAAQSELALWSGRPDLARDLAEQSLAIPAPIVAGHIKPRLAGAWARWELGIPPGDAIEAPLPPSVAGAAPELAGLTALHEEDHRAAADAFAMAAEAWAAFEAPRTLLCRWATAEARRRAGDTTNAIEELRQVLVDAEAMGFQPLGARLRRSLRLAGVHLPAGPRDDKPDGTGLTRRERELVDLVEHGLTNIEIARRLGLGRPTVKRILASAMGKVGAERRTQLVGQGREV